MTAIPVGYKRLACATIIQACKDLRCFPREVERFLCGDSPIMALVPEVDGEAVLKAAQNNYEQYGRYSVPNMEGYEDE